MQHNAKKRHRLFRQIPRVLLSVRALGKCAGRDAQPPMGALKGNSYLSESKTSRDVEEGLLPILAYLGSPNFMLK